ncbi:hypothetical protein [Bradyrhizobium prioriisuperbiae]|uniref:hypothetical protein n=1 Tax=Bradyrhizobium prioriisuperbiae TaxID=2854389 RepID=UPI0028EBF284|nr:hypothetical protein [Bradyrhizobium prioritasuperba]
MPPTSSDQASQRHGGVHPLLRSFAQETRALLLRLLAYLCIPIALVLIAMELWSASQSNLTELIDSATKTISSKESARAEAPLKQASDGIPNGDRTPTTDTTSDRAANQQTPPVAAPAPAPRDQMRRQRLLEPTKSRTDVSCQDKEQGKAKGLAKTEAKAERGRCDRAAAADGIDTEGAPRLRGRI